MAKKFYAVKKGKTTGIFQSWDDCREAVSGYPGAQYKGFASKEEAEAYLGLKAEEDAGRTQDSAQETVTELTAYVDGSFDEAIGKYSFGCVILTPQGEIIRRSGSGSQPESLAIRNVAGEMLGAMYAARWAVVNGYGSLRLCYDYQGIEKWAVGEWKAKNPLTQKYAEFMAQQRRLIAIHFQKIKAHSGDLYNEEADTLAKEALLKEEGIPPMRES